MLLNLKNIKYHDDIWQIKKLKFIFFNEVFCLFFVLLKVIIWTFVLTIYRLRLTSEGPFYTESRKERDTLLRQIHRGGRFWNWQFLHHRRVWIHSRCHRTWHVTFWYHFFQRRFWGRTCWIWFWILKWLHRFCHGNNLEVMRMRRRFLRFWTAQKPTQ